MSWDSEISDFMVFGAGTIQSQGISIWESNPNILNRFSDDLPNLSPFHSDKDFWNEILASGWFSFGF